LECKAALFDAVVFAGGGGSLVLAAVPTDIPVVGETFFHSRIISEQ
jgi:hypothetical protein